MEPREFAYRVQGWLPNTLYEPMEIGTNDLNPAIDAARALAHGQTFHRTVVIDQSNLEIAHFVNMEWGKP